MLKKLINIRIGLRTIKTTAAVILSMVIVYFYGTTDSRLIFAMLGAMAAVQTSFKESLESCLTQIVGVISGAFMGIVLLALPLHPLAACGIGIIVVITLYNHFRIRFSPSLACLIVVILCTSPDAAPVEYAVGRIWDTAIGLFIGMLINTLVFPYDNSAQIRATVQSLDKELIRFLEDMYDGDDVFPDMELMTVKIDEMARQLAIFSNQKFLRDHSRQQKQLETFRVCAVKARQLVAHMEVLCHMGQAGHLSRATLTRLKACGADIKTDFFRDSIQEKDLIINYHINKLLTLREELLDALEQ
ncbi:MAG: FUSC family protein [Oscillospiraceae bacterium]|nr:FUSC family protein [Oscillospiraceae bacterium]